MVSKNRKKKKKSKVFCVGEQEATAALLVIWGCCLARSNWYNLQHQKKREPMYAGDENERCFRSGVSVDGVSISTCKVFV